MTDRVAVLGGGVGGLTAAHELATRGFDVTVYEAGDRVGGKARSVRVPDSGDPGLPGEHGFRFFPGYYRHVTSTMARIPDGDGGVVADHLVPTEATLLGGSGGVVADTTTPDTLSGWYDSLRPGDEAIPAREQAFFAERLVELLTSCDERRREELDERTWWDFLDADRMSDAFQRQVASTQSLVALAPKRASARTVGRIYVQLLRGQLDPRMDAERVLDGPTSEVWLEPWCEHLASLGVAVVTDAAVTALHVDGGGAMAGVTLERGGSTERVTADHYVAAVPVEVMADLLTADLRRADPELAGIDQLDTAWMNGLQFYLSEDVPVVRGHQVFPESPWAITAISQAQFWDVDLSARADGVEGVLSVIVSNWNEPGPVTGKPARECTPAEIREEVWTQVAARVDDLDESLVVDWFLDPELRETEEGMVNDAPLLINTVGSLKHRPSADPDLTGLTLAADYVDTHSDLASMEAANEAGRRAAGAVVGAAGVDADRPPVWDLEEPALFDPLKADDRLRYRMGVPNHTRVRRDLGAALRKLRP